VTDPEPAAPNPLRGPVPPGLKRWVMGARPRTLGAAVVPVAVGTALGRWINTSLLDQLSVVYHGRVSLAHPYGLPTGINWWYAVLALLVALGIQVGTNYANDFSDGVRGTDEVRAGPQRLVASGLATPDEVRVAALVAFGLAGVAGLILAASTSWWLLAVGAASVLAGLLYTGGPRPYGYLGLGEPFVFVFFGLVATMGSTYVQVHRILLVSFVAALPVGFVAMALLEANNLRDITGDEASGKRTLAVRLGRPRADWLYIGSLMAAALSVGVLAHWRPWVLLALLALPLAVAPARAMLSGAEGRKLLPVLGATGQIQWALGALLTVGILL
jgi:1,4-dihydroxy-2-naphthoate octaprenyltransferase